MKKVEIDPQILTRLAAICVAAGDMMMQISDAKADKDVVTAIDQMTKRITSIYSNPKQLEADVTIAYLVSEGIPLDKISIMFVSDLRKN